MFTKGDIVLVNKEVYGARYNGKRILYKPHWFKPHRGIVLGFSFIYTGTITSFSYDGYDDIAELKITKTHKIWLIEPLTKSKRYLKPIRALESDIEPL